MNNFEIDIERLRDAMLFQQTSPLLFNTGLFLLLFTAFIGIYQLMRGSQTVKMIMVILFSLYFYYKSSAEYCFILLGVCIGDFVLGTIMGKCQKTWQKKIVLMINVVINVGMLIYFKYFNLLLSTISDFAGSHFDPLDIILPAGISFFTFRSISYMVDIYRGSIQPCHNFLAYTFYLTFFPPLLAGPVVRAKDMLPQIEADPTATKAMVSEGLFLIIAGLIKKVVVADFISQNFVDRVFDNPSLYSGFENMMAVYGFTIQLYCDFSGYSDMAIGIALLLGYRFFDNFRSPFKSQSPTEFWRRWHISLSSWLRDYVYIPLGGNRKGKTRQNINLVTTMVVGGLWHGASWMYMIWGFWHGILLVLHKFLKKVFHLKKEESEKKTSRWRVAANIFITFNLVALGFMFFRAESMEKVGDMVRQIFTNFHISVAPQFIEGYLMIFLAILFGYAMHFAPSRWNNRLQSTFHNSGPWLQAIILAIILLVIIQVRQSDIVPFIYLQY